MGESKPETATQRIRVDANIIAACGFGLPGRVWTAPLFEIEKTRLRLIKTRPQFCFYVFLILINLV